MIDVNSNVVLDDSNFFTYVQFVNFPVLVCFRATFCRFDSSMDSLLSLCRSEYSNDLLVFSAYVENCFSIFRRFDIRNVPTFAFFNNKLLSSRSGAFNQEQLFAFIDSNI